MNAQTRSHAPHGDRSKLHVKEVPGIGDGVGANVAAESFRIHRYLIVCLRAKTLKKKRESVYLCTPPLELSATSRHERVFFMMFKSGRLL